MGDTSDKPEESALIDRVRIPPPGPTSESPSGPRFVSRVEALRELQGFSRGHEGPLKRAAWDWKIQLWLKLILFAFIVLVNVWWPLKVWTWSKNQGPSDQNSTSMTAC